MAYKDEYEVARLHSKPELARALTKSFGEDARWQLLLHPPLLRALGLKRKLAFGAWFRPALRLLARLKFLRGTSFDPFGLAKVRRVERALIDEYREIIEEQLISLTRERCGVAVELAELPEDDPGLRRRETPQRRTVSGVRARAACCKRSFLTRPCVSSKGPEVNRRRPRSSPKIARHGSQTAAHRQKRHVMARQGLRSATTRTPTGRRARPGSA